MILCRCAGHKTLFWFSRVVERYSITYENNNVFGRHCATSERKAAEGAGANLEEGFVLALRSKFFYINAEFPKK